MIGPLVLLAALGCPARGDADVSLPDGVELRADTVVLEGGTARGAGDVRVVAGGVEVRGQGFTLGADGVLEVEEGVLAHPRGTLVFQRARLDPMRSEILLEGATWSATDGALDLAADRIRLPETGPWELEDAVVAPCPCPDGSTTWTLRVRRARVAPGEAVAFHGGVLRLGALPVLPVPAGSIPLARRSGLLPPEIRHTADGWELAAPAYLTLGPHADVTVAPTWREERGLRGLAEVRYTVAGGGGQAALEGGPDGVEETWRGQATWHHVQARGPRRLAVAATRTRDLAWSDDFGTSWLSRQRPFQETRLLGAWGPLRLAHDSFQSETSVPQHLGSLLVSLPPVGMGALAPGAEAEAALVGWGADPAALDAAWLLARGRASVDGAARLGALETSGRLEAEARLLRELVGEPGAAGAMASGEVRTTLPLWAHLGQGRLVLEPSLGGGAGGVALDDPMGEASQAMGLPWGADALQVGLESADVAWWTGPRLDARWIGDAVPLHARAEAAWTPEGLVPAAAAWARTGQLWAEVQGRARTGALDLAGGLGWDGGTLDAWSRVLVLATGEAQVTGGGACTLELRGHQLSPGLGARVSLEEGRFLERRVGLGWRPPCGCFGLEAAAALAEDRPLPDLALRLEWRP